MYASDLSGCWHTVSVRDINILRVQTHRSEEWSGSGLPCPFDCDSVAYKLSGDRTAYRIADAMLEVRVST